MPLFIDAYLADHLCRRKPSAKGAALHRLLQQRSRPSVHRMVLERLTSRVLRTIYGRSARSSTSRLAQTMHALQPRVDALVAVDTDRDDPWSELMELLFAPLKVPDLHNLLRHIKRRLVEIRGARRIV